jgi:hypothetical protein
MSQFATMPICSAAPLDDAQAAPAIEALPSEQAISREEEALLWRYRVGKIELERFKK